MGDRVAILGAAGAIGRACADEFERRGTPLTVTGRDEVRLAHSFGDRAEIRAADLADIDKTEAAVRGAGAAVYCAGHPCPQFEQHLVLVRSALEAARRAGVSRMVVVSSVYSYGHPRTSPVSADHRREPESARAAAAGSRRMPRWKPTAAADCAPRCSTCPASTDPTPT